MSRLEMLVQNQLLSAIEVHYPDEIDLFEIAYRLQVLVLSKPCLSTLSGTANHPVIVLDNRLTTAEQRVQLAHELCHFVAHSGDQLFMSPLFRSYQESQTRRMTMYLLSPTHMLTDSLNAMASQHIHPLLSVAQSFDIPYDFAKRRLDLYRLEFTRPVKSDVFTEPEQQILFA
ncbi:ImmA/IrrE family metallo-endopeptidase [Alicyclobacillus sp. SO9]|uniref:ImmA/IrrE family metallo-endopeptidase n=1 Tax=Alicyclobacillus sp. SO9 TaxID=2665646 RepID=UPI0018E88495|nr:ImmA/IrrE family metallo-endopeptidase [Alicyclobacillus sp. SO9]QQE79500.1 ImmA/IrrE family metallo-endopeptidase [Alicyclobacillus sp. SO9]